VAITVPAGTTILAAAAKAGVFINSLCGGDGVCGRCRVIVREGRALGGSTEFFTHQEIQRGFILACEARIESDMVVEVPPETRLAEVPVTEAEVPHLADLSRVIRGGATLSPLVRKTYLELPPPSLENNISDLQRLEHGLQSHLGGRSVQMGLKVTRRLPNTLRRANWKVTVTTGHRGALSEVLDVEAGNTTRRNMCLAADIGTTTIVCHLVDLHDGRTYGQAAKYNSQASYGADVIHRIIHASRDEESQNALRQAVVDDINELMHQLVMKFRMGTQDITLVSAAGNTTMTQLLLGLPVENIRKEPYVGVAYDLPPFRAAEVGLQVNSRALLYLVPCVSAFVGGDVVAGIFASGMAQQSGVRMLIDIGTNGEIAVGNKDFMVCASASAGPAFEGAECRSGMRATRGAVDHLHLADPDHVQSFATIGQAPPAGLCGTGYVDLVAEMLRVGLIDKTGRLRPEVSKRVRAGANGELEYVLFPVLRDRSKDSPVADIAISQGDITNILRAKAAIYAAASVLLKALHLRFDELEEVLVAGAFGNFLNVENAVSLGLLPDIPLSRLRFVGNTSLAGAKLAALSERCLDEIAKIAAGCTYFELSTDPGFMEQFVSACFFPHTNVELFPSVMQSLAARR
jgi:uncharacterized 2Fe-2S/4Fe-4S cluster protein (DUF4445 family)